MKDASESKVNQALAWAGITGPPLFVLTFTVAGWLRPGYSAMRDAVSDLGVGAQVWIQNANFLVVGLLLLTFAAGFARIMRDVIGSRPSRMGAALIALTGVGLMAAGLFPATAPTEWLHFLFGFFLPVGAAIAADFYVGRKLRSVVDWESLARYSFWTGIGDVGLVIVSFVALNPSSPLAEVGVGGLIERILIVEILAWHFVTGSRLNQYAAGKSVRSSAAATS